MTRFFQNLTRKWKPFLLDRVNIQLLSNYIESSVIDLPANPQNVISPSAVPQFQKYLGKSSLLITQIYKSYTLNTKLLS